MPPSFSHGSQSTTHTVLWLSTCLSILYPTPLTQWALWGPGVFISLPLVPEPVEAHEFVESMNPWPHLSQLPFRCHHSGGDTSKTVSICQCYKNLNGVMYNVPWEQGEGSHGSFRCLNQLYGRNMPGMLTFWKTANGKSTSIYNPEDQLKNNL